MQTAIHHQHPLLTKIVASIFLIAALVSIIAASVQLYLTYSIERKHIVEMLDRLEDSQINTLVNNIWSMDQNALHIQLNGILEHPNIISIHYTDENGSETFLGSSPDKTTNTIRKNFILSKFIEQQSKYLGEIEFLATSKNIKNRLFADISKALCAQLATIFFTCITILFVFVRLFNRHINRIIEYTEALKVEQLDSQLTLHRKKLSTSKQDELDRIVDAINNMQERLKKEIATQKQIKRNLYEEKLFSDAIINSLPGILFVLDSRYKPIKFNRLFKNKLGIKEDQIHNYDIFSRIASRDSLRVRETVSQVIRDGNTVSLEVYLLSGSGKEIPFLFTISALELESEKLLIGVGADIRDQKIIEAQLRQAQKMEAIGTLAGGIAHDFNNILSALIGYNQLALLASQDNSKVQKYLKQTQKASERAKELVAQILAFSRKTKTEKTSVKLNLILEEALKLLRSSIPSSIEIRKNITVEHTIFADSTEIHQIIMNLCTNAFQAMQQNGGILSICLTDRIVTQRDFFPDANIPPGKYINLEISDTGPGMDNTLKAKIFEPYFTTKEAGVGTGLGLAVVHGIVTQNGGYVCVYSKPGQGTTFNIYLPITHDAAISLETKEDNSALKMTGGDEKIIVVDDDSSILQYYSELLGNFGYSVTPFVNSIDALEHFRKNNNTYDLVITDLTMPSISGKQLGQEMLDIQPDIPIIICSGFSGELGRNSFIELGFSDYLQKPIDSNLLLSRIRQIFDSA